MSRSFSDKSYDVAVVGSGPAGSSAALGLAKEGVRVALLEKASLPRYKTCGGAVVRRAIRLLPVDIGSAVERHCNTVELHLLDARLHFSVTRSHPITAMTMRENLDFLLASAAQEAGAHLRDRCEVRDVVVQTDKVELVTTDGPIFARFVVAADGAMSSAARKAGCDETRHLIPALECEILADDDVLRRFNNTARFDLGAVPYGYAWVFPKREHLSIGVLTTRRGTINLNTMLEQYMKLIGLNNITRLERHGFLIPVRPRKGPFVWRRTVLTGDAAGFADPVTAEGITFAIQSGQMAAGALLEGDLDEARVRQAYDSAVQKTILPELRFGRILAKLLFYDYPRLRTSLFRLYGQKITEALTDVFMGERTYRQILQSPLTYLKLFRFWGLSANRLPGRLDNLITPPEA